MGIDIGFDPDTVNYFQANYKISELEPEELFAMVKRANRRFYLNPARSLNTLVRLPHKSQIISLFGMFLQRSLGLAKVKK